jgi:hypothetical protein
MDIMKQLFLEGKMATRKQNTSGTEGAGKIKDLKLNKQTVRDLSAEDSSKIKGGRQLAETRVCGTETCAPTCAYVGAAK